MKNHDVGARSFRGQSKGEGNDFWHSWAGGMLLRPWYDKLALPALARFYCPLSRAWAEALDEAAPADRPRHLGGLLGRKPDKALVKAVQSARSKWHDYEQVAADWEGMLFSANPASRETLKNIHKKRKRAAYRAMNARSGFLTPHMRQSFRGVRVDIDPYEKVLAAHGDRLSGAMPAFGVPDSLPDVQHSAQVVGKKLYKSWLKLPSPLGDTLWARLSVPKDVAEPVGTLIMCHGVGMEDEFWGSSLPKTIASQGMRVLSPEGPWHGRRRLAGYYGGEPVLARGPGGLLDYFHYHGRELALLVRWVRDNIGGPVALGGISLGALTSQLVATASHSWPDIYRPDAYLLVTPSPSIRAVAFEGRLTQSLGVTDAVMAEGWTPDSVAQWAPLLEPQGAPTVAANRLVFVVGDLDEVTPAHTGRAFIDRWQLPDENAFIRPGGHFTTALGLLRDPTPLHRMAQILSDIK